MMKEPRAGARHGVAALIGSAWLACSPAALPTVSGPALAHADVQTWLGLEAGTVATYEIYRLGGNPRLRIHSPITVDVHSP